MSNRKVERVNSGCSQASLVFPAVSDPVASLDQMPDKSFKSFFHYARTTRGRRTLWMIGLLAVAIRVLLLPFGHAWDLTIDYDFFIDLARNHSPYDTFNYLSHIAIASQWDQVYEYYAYPPIPIYIYYPLAQIYHFLHPHAQYFIPVSGSYAVPSLKLDFFFLYKFPIWVADFLVAALLARMSGTIRGFRDYLLNPYVLLVSGAWTFDAVMLLGLVAAVYFVQRERFTLSGIALAFGTMVKFFPVIALPAIVIYMIKKNRPLRDIVVFLLAYGIACLVFLGPFAPGVISVVTFHGSRPGGGMTWQNYWNSWALTPQGVSQWPMLAALGSFGTIQLVIVFMLLIWYLWITDMSLNRMIVVTILAFFLGSKLINEQYALLIFPFLWLEAHHVGGIWRWFYRLFWIVPVAFTVFHVPVDHFFWLLYHMLFDYRANVTLNGTTGFEWTMIIWKHPVYAQVITNFLGGVFLLVSLVAFFWPVRRSNQRLTQRLRLRDAGTVRPGPTIPTTPAPVITRDVVLSEAE